MYERHFGLSRKPFEVSPDPAFYYESEPLRETLATMIYGIRERRGLLSLVGAEGTGKSTLLAMTSASLDPMVSKVVISHSTLDRDELVAVLCHELGSALERGSRADGPLARSTHERGGRPAGWTRVDGLAHLRKLLQEVDESGRPAPVVIVDEAQNLSAEVLEEIRLLSNIELPHGPLLQIVLAGQPGLEAKLESPALAPLKQRIAVPLRLFPLDAEQTAAYVGCRLRVAGAHEREIFAPTAVDAIVAASGGVPRVINALCEWCLVNAYAMGRDRVDESLAWESTRDLRLPSANLHALAVPPASPVTTRQPRLLARDGAPSTTKALPPPPARLAERVDPRPAYGVLVATYRVYSKAKAHAGKLSRLGHEAHAIRTALGDGTRVSQVMVGVNADRRRARETAELLVNDGIDDVEVTELSGWDASVGLVGLGRAR